MVSPPRTQLRPRNYAFSSREQMISTTRNPGDPISRISLQRDTLAAAERAISVLQDRIRLLEDSDSDSPTVAAESGTEQSPATPNTSSSRPAIVYHSIFDRLAGEYHPSLRNPLPGVGAGPPTHHHVQHATGGSTPSRAMPPGATSSSQMDRLRSLAMGVTPAGPGGLDGPRGTADRQTHSTRAADESRSETDQRRESRRAGMTQLIYEAESRVAEIGRRVERLEDFRRQARDRRTALGREIDLNALNSYRDLSEDESGIPSITNAVDVLEAFENAIDGSNTPDRGDRAARVLEEEQARWSILQSALDRISRSPFERMDEGQAVVPAAQAIEGVRGATPMPEASQRSLNDTQAVESSLPTPLASLTAIAQRGPTGNVLRSVNQPPREAESDDVANRGWDNDETTSEFISTFAAQFPELFDRDDNVRETQVIRDHPERRDQDQDEVPDVVTGPVGSETRLALFDSSTDHTMEFRPRGSAAAAFRLPGTGIPMASRANRQVIRPSAPVPQHRVLPSSTRIVNQAGPINNVNAESSARRSVETAVDGTGEAYHPSEERHSLRPTTFHADIGPREGESAFEEEARGQLSTQRGSGVRRSQQLLTDLIQPREESREVHRWTRKLERGEWDANGNPIARTPGLSTAEDADYGVVGDAELLYFRRGNHMTARRGSMGPYGIEKGRLIGR